MQTGPMVVWVVVRGNKEVTGAQEIVHPVFNQPYNRPTTCFAVQHCLVISVASAVACLLPSLSITAFPFGLSAFLHISPLSIMLGQYLRSTQGCG